MSRRNENEAYIKIGKNIKNLRSCAGLTQMEFGNILGLSFQQIQKYETGKNRIPTLQLYALHKTLKIPFENFFQDVSLAPSLTPLSPQEILIKRIQKINDDKTAWRALQILEAASLLKD